jgi:hypothetical protein
LNTDHPVGQSFYGANRRPTAVPDDEAPGFDTRTFECQKCGHVHTMTVSRDPMAASLHGWLTGELKAPT